MYFRPEALILSHQGSPLSMSSLRSSRLFYVSNIFIQLTTNSDLLAMASGNTVDIWQHPEPLPRLKQQLEDVARVQLLLGETLVSKKALDIKHVNRWSYCQVLITAVIL